MDKWYLGSTEAGRIDIFACDDPKQATPDASGYYEVDGPYTTRQDAEEARGDY